MSRKWLTHLVSQAFPIWHRGLIKSTAEWGLYWLIACRIPCAIGAKHLIPLLQIRKRNHCAYLKSLQPFPPCLLHVLFSSINFMITWALFVLCPVWTAGALRYLKVKQGCSLSTISWTMFLRKFFRMPTVRWSFTSNTSLHLSIDGLPIKHCGILKYRKLRLLLVGMSINGKSWLSKCHHIETRANCREVHQSTLTGVYENWFMAKRTPNMLCITSCRPHNETFEKVSNAKIRLENTVLEGSSVATSERVLGVTFLQEVTHQLPSWHKKARALRFWKVIEASKTFFS